MNLAEQSLARALDATAPAPDPGIGATGSGEPAFTRALRRSGAEDFRRLLLPTTRHEDWRYTSLQPLAGLTLAPAAPLRAAASDLAQLGELPPAPRLVLVNGRLDPALTDLAGLPSQASAGSLAVALREAPGRIEPHLVAGAGPFRDHAFAALSAALFADGVVLHLPEGARLEHPLHVVHLAIGAGAGPGETPAVFPRVLVIAGKGARATVVEHWAGSGRYLAAGLTELVLGEGAQLELVRLQREAPEAIHVGMVGVAQGQDSRFTARSVALGGRLARLELRVVLEGEGAASELDGLYVAGGEQLHDHFVHVDHARARGTSRELFKGILDGSSRGVFSGRVLVRAGAQKTDAGQVSSSLLLSDDATVDARPQLEILADDVKCSHGGTVGQLDENALFYLRSRGLDRATARALLTWAFAAEMVERLPGGLRAGVRALVTARLPGGDRLQEAA